MERNYSKLLENILGNIEKAFTSANFYWESGSVILCLVVGVLAYKSARQSYLNYHKDKKPSDITKRFLAPLALPISMLIVLMVGVLLFSIFFPDNFLFFTAMQIIALFVFLRFLRLLFNSSFIANIVALFLIPTILLNILGLLEPTIFFLDQFAFNIGKIRISVYTVIQAFFILSIVFWVSGIISRKAKQYFQNKADLRTSTKGIIAKVIDISIYFIVFVIILRVFGVDMTAFAVIGGAIGVGIGFGLQKIASNFISGMILLMEKSVEIGDIVELDNGNIYGTITHFGGRYTLIESMDGKEIMVPNEDFIVGRVTNWTFNNHRVRIEIKFLVSYGTDLKKTKEIILNIANAHPRCLKYPEAECFFNDLSENGISVTVYFWVGDIAAGRMGPKSDVITQILDQFKENHIEIPTPQREVILKRR